MYDIQRTTQTSGGVFKRWLDRLGAPLPSSHGCRGCGQPTAVGARYCVRCGRPVFRVGASDEVELAADRTVSVADGLLLVRYEPRSPRARWRTTAKGASTGDSLGPALVVKAEAQPEWVEPVRPLSSFNVDLRFAAISLELTAADVTDVSLHLIVRRTG